MSEKEIWIVSVKSRPLEGCTVNFDGSEFLFVECLIPVSNSDEATASLEHAHLDKRLELVEIINSAPYKPEEWEVTEQFPQIEKAAKKAKQNDSIEFGLFISSRAMEEDDDSEGDDGIDWS